MQNNELQKEPILPTSITLLKKRFIIIGIIILVLFIAFFSLIIFYPSDSSDTTTPDSTSAKTQQTSEDKSALGSFVKNSRNVIRSIPLIGGLVTTNPAPSSPQSKTVTGLEVAERITTFLDTASKENGEFYGLFSCYSETGSCTPNEISTTHTGQIILAYYELGKITGNKNYSNKANTAINTVLEKCIKDTQYCEWNFFPLYTYYMETRDEKYKEAMLTTSSKLFDSIPIDIHVLENRGVKYEMLYNATADNQYKTIQIQYADAIVDNLLDKSGNNVILYSHSDGTLRTITFLSVWTDLLPAYRVTKDEKYLIKAQNILTEANIDTYLSEIIEKSIGPSSFKQPAPAWNTSQFLVIALENYLNLEQDDSNNKTLYQKRAHTIAQKILDSYMDSSENKYYNGDNGILTFAEGNLNSKDTLNNGWLARMLLKMDTEKFQISK